MSRFSRARNVKDPVAALTARGDCQCMKKVKPPIAPAGCVETPSTKGVNLIVDPGFEQSYPGGPNGATFPGEVGAGQGPWEPEWSDDTGHGVYSPWMVFTNNGGDTFNSNMWEISTLNPRSGSQHARFFYDAGFSGHTIDIIPMDVEVCNAAEDFTYVSNAAYMSAILSPGDVVTLGAYAAYTPGASDEYSFNCGLDFWSQDWAVRNNNFWSYFPNIPKDGNYYYYEASFVAPSIAYWVSASYLFSTESGFFGTTGDTFDIDDASLVIT